MAPSIEPHGPEEARPDASQPVVDDLAAAFYDELRLLARLRRRGDGDRIGTTSLAHEAFLKLARDRNFVWNDKAHFLATASRVMRRLLVDLARRRRALRHGAGAVHVELDESLIPEAEEKSLIGLDDSLHALEADHPRAARTIAARYFGGFANEEIAEALGVSVPTVERDLRFARAWLARRWRSEP